jgi:hypothetical protein
MLAQISKIIVAQPLDLPVVHRNHQPVYPAWLESSLPVNPVTEEESATVASLALKKPLVSLQSRRAGGHW